MKYYKLLTKNGWPDDSFILNKIYQEDCVLGWSKESVSCVS